MTLMLPIGKWAFLRKMRFSAPEVIVLPDEILTDFALKIKDPQIAPGILAV